MREIRILLRGGLGNQLFQICGSVYHAKRLSCGVKLDDSQIYRHQDATRQTWSRKIDLRLLFDFDELKWINRPSRTLASRWSGHRRHAHLISEIDLKGEVQIDRKLLLQGWFESKFYALQVFSKLALNAETVRNALNSTELLRGRSLASAAVHIRLGDFKRSPQGVLEKRIYQRGVEKLLANGITRIDCYSDDIVEAKEILKPYVEKDQINFPESRAKMEPQVLLAAFTTYRYFVSSNSTLSWWGAFLNINAKSIYSSWREDLCLENWKHL